MNIKIAHETGAIFYQAVKSIERNLAIESLKEVIEINLNELNKRALKEECK